jgi:hypothetical protein
MRVMTSGVTAVAAVAVALLPLPAFTPRAALASGVVGTGTGQGEPMERALRASFRNSVIFSSTSRGDAIPGSTEDRETGESFA